VTVRGGQLDDAKGKLMIPRKIVVGDAYEGWNQFLDSGHSFTIVLRHGCRR